MIHTVVLSRRAQKDLMKMPRHISRKLTFWMAAVEKHGLEKVRLTAGHHDEPLMGKRLGQRSIRLSLHYRAIYALKKDGAVPFVSLEEVNKHAY